MHRQSNYHRAVRPVGFPTARRDYRELLSKLKDNDNATKKLSAAQRAWLAFKDAHIQELYPAGEKQAEYGSKYPMCYAQVATEMTKERTAQLRKMLDDNA